MAAFVAGEQAMRRKRVEADGRRIREQMAGEIPRSDGKGSGVN